MAAAAPRIIMVRAAIPMRLITFLLSLYVPTCIAASAGDIPAQSIDQKMGLAGRLKHPVAPGRFEDDLAGLPSAHAVAGRDVDRFDPVPRAQDDADPLTPVDEHPKTSPFLGRLLVLADQDALGAPDRGQIEQEAPVAGGAKAARVGDPLSVTQQAVGPPLEARHGLQDRRSFAK